MFTLDELKGIRDGSKTAEDRLQMDRDMYVRGKKGYHTASPDTLPQGLTERDKTCYQMGYNTAEWEDTNA